MKIKSLCVIVVAGLLLAACQSKPVKTIENLKAAIKGETTASAKYKAFAQKAREEQLDSIAKLFEAASKAESIHATNHLKVLEGLGVRMEEIKPEFEVRSTAENLQAALEGESYEVATMYPDFIASAKSENTDKALKSFTWAFDTEKKHQAFYAKAIEALKNKKMSTLSNEYYVCPVCGNTYEKGTVDEKCSFCQTSKEKFNVI